jgi:glutamate racemase
MKTAIRIGAAYCGHLGALFMALLVGVALSTNALAQTETTSEWLPALLEKESITFVITDSGLGGLSVVADAAEKLKQYAGFKDVNLVFVNALFRDAGGYNSLQSREDKLKVFSSALQSMQDRYSPDIILVACNTLSVLVPDTEFVATSSVPVVGIVENGVEQIAEQLRDKPGARNIVFATQTTVDEGTHKNLLLDQGFNDTQIVTQSCPQLTLYIEQGYDSMYTEMLIDAYVDEALSGMGETTGPLTVSFNCTHFGYSMNFWKQAFASRGVDVSAFLDPNTLMIDFLLPSSSQHRYPQTDITVNVVSMIDIPADRLDSIGRYLHTASPVTETALQNFELIPALFQWRDLISATAE